VKGIKKMNKKGRSKSKMLVNISFNLNSLFYKFFRVSDIAEEPIIFKFHPFLPFPTPSAILLLKINNLWKNFMINYININKY
jgi:hypothetical protein